MISRATTRPTPGSMSRPARQTPAPALLLPATLRCKYQGPRRATALVARALPRQIHATQKIPAAQPGGASGGTDSRRLEKVPRDSCLISRAHDQLGALFPRQPARGKLGEIGNRDRVNARVVVFPVVDRLALQRIQTGLHRARGIGLKTLTAGSFQPRLAA